MPYGNTIDKVRLTGSDLLKVLEVPMVTFDPSIPIYGFLQVSGERTTNSQLSVKYMKLFKEKCRLNR